MKLRLTERKLINLHIDFKDYDEFEEFFIGLKGKYMSPGGVANRLGVSRQLVNVWIRRDVINSYRYDGVEGQFVIIPFTEIEKAIIHMQKSKSNENSEDKNSIKESLSEMISRLLKK